MLYWQAETPQRLTASSDKEQKRLTLDPPTIDDGEMETNTVPSEGRLAANLTF